MKYEPQFWNGEELPGSYGRHRKMTFWRRFWQCLTPWQTAG